MPEPGGDAGSGPSGESPYLSARREWDERMGDAIAREHIWKRVAFVCLLITVLAVGGLVYSASQNKFIPYLVAFDDRDRLRPLGTAERAAPVEARFQKALLAEFIEGLRSVVADGYVQRQRIHKAYAMLRTSDAATGMVSAYFQNRSPYERAKTETVSVQLDTILPLTDQTWRLEWRETLRDRTGAETGTERWSATATVVIVPPSDEETILKNPAGLYVTDLSWSQRMAQ